MMGFVRSTPLRHGLKQKKARESVHLLIPDSRPSHCPPIEISNSASPRQDRIQKPKIRLPGREETPESEKERKYRHLRRTLSCRILPIGFKVAKFESRRKRRVNAFVIKTHHYPSGPVRWRKDINYFSLGKIKFNYLRSKGWDLELSHMLISAE